MGMGAGMGGMRSTPSSTFLRSSFGQLTDLQVSQRRTSLSPLRVGGGWVGGWNGLGGWTDCGADIHVNSKKVLAARGFCQTAVEGR